MVIPGRAMKRSLEDLVKLSNKELTELFARGTTPNTDELVGWELRGFNKPFITKLGGFQKFRKGFFLVGEEVWGYNIPVVQGDVSEPWKSLPSDDAPKRFGFYRVRPAGAGDKEPGSLLLDYSQGDNHLWEGSFLRDYVKQVDADNPDLYLGKAYSSLLGAQIAPTIFIIERNRPGPRTLD